MYAYFFVFKNEDVAEKVAQTSRESSACVRKRGLEQAIGKVDEDNIRLRKKLDLVKYESDKVILIPRNIFHHST